MLLLPVTPAGAAQIVVLTIAFSVGTIFNSVSIAVNAEISPTRQRAAVMGTCTGLVTTAGLIAPYLTGQIIQTADSPAAGYTVSFTIAGVLLLASGVLALLFMRPEHTRNHIGLGG
nr:MFS transporter [Sciscionella marina]